MKEKKGIEMTLFILMSFLFIFNIFYSLEYNVKDNDTLWSISKKFNVDIRTIEKLNEIVVLKKGQTLFIPEDIVNYKVKEGDSLLSIAKKFSVKLTYIIILNNLKDETIYTGQILKVPIDSKIDSLVGYKEENENLKRKTEHIVKKGETLYSISKLYGVKLEEILMWNNKTDKSIFVGERLKIYLTSDGYSLSKNISTVNSRSAWIFPLKDRNLVVGYSREKRGLKIYLKSSTEVVSINSGVVEYVGHINGYDKVLILRVNDYKVVYGYLSKVYLKKGDRVNAGDLIGSVDYHEFIGKIAFYIEIRKGKSPINIDEFLKIEDRLFAKS